MGNSIYKPPRLGGMRIEMVLPLSGDHVALIYIRALPAAYEGRWGRGEICKARRIPDYQVLRVPLFLTGAILRFRMFCNNFIPVAAGLFKLRQI
jgi:hypothetical protein